MFPVGIGIVQIFYGVMQCVCHGQLRYRRIMTYLRVPVGVLEYRKRIEFLFDVTRKIIPRGSILR
jgi:hypothetical protein